MIPTVRRGGIPADCSGGDTDLGSPNTDFAGPGVDADGVATTGGNAGSPFQNDTALELILIVAEDLIDTSPADGLVDDPDDADLNGQFLEFNFKKFKGVSR